MRKLILQEFVTLDGFAADANGTTSFFENLTGKNGEDIDNDLLHFISTIDTILLGANTYRMFVDYWPSATTQQEIVADELNKTSKVVFSKTLQCAPWGKWPDAKIISTDAVGEVKKLKQQPGKDMVLWGSLQLAQSFLSANLIDEVQLRVCPVVLGEGKPLFTKETSAQLNLKDSKVYKAGVVLLSYQC
jgi:dihydrofolate reductase